MLDWIGVYSSLVHISVVIAQAAPGCHGVRAAVRAPAAGVDAEVGDLCRQAGRSDLPNVTP